MKTILSSLFYKCLKIRLFEEEIIKLYPEKQMRCPIHLSIGQEGIATGVCQALSKKDYVFSNHRSHAHYIAKGGDIKKMMAEFYGKSTGCCRGRGGSMHLIDKSVGFLGSTPIVAGTIPVGAGVAFASKLKGENNITVVFLGDASIEEGVFHETMNFCSLHSLPIIFICENNLYSVYTNISERQPNRKIIEVAKAHGIDFIKADGNNALEVFNLTKRIVQSIKKGQVRPYFIELSTYRWREHCGINYDNNLGYREKSEFNLWKERDPLKILSKNLDKKEIKQIERKVKGEINSAVQFAKKSPFPLVTELNKYLFLK